MRNLVHISDLHFGRTQAAVVRALAVAIHQLAPHLLVVSGDLTQRAKSLEFKQAHNFLQSFNCDKIVVPGNHDIPLYNWAARIWQPLARYKRYISSNLKPHYEDDEMSVIGLNTAHPWTVAGGAMTDQALREIQTQWKSSERLKILVTHHPFEDLTTENPNRRWGYKSSLPLVPLLECQPDILLSGHLHQSAATLSTQVLKTPHRSVICIQAGTAVSERQRTEANAFNRLLLEPQKIQVEKMIHEAGTFKKESTQIFHRGPEGWKQE